MRLSKPTETHCHPSKYGGWIDLEEHVYEYRDYASKKNVLKMYESEKRQIEKSTGLRLSNIEALGLRLITEEVMNEIMKEIIDDVCGFSCIAPYSEIPCRFFWTFYGIPPGQISRLFPCFYNDNNEPTELTREYFRREQEKRHMP